jgi:glycerol-3-phosphate dehydrogenase (NAD(P)+)
MWHRCDDAAGMTAKHILIVGYGEMGRAMEYLLAQRHTLSFWNRSPMPGHACADLERCAGSIDYLVYCVPVSPVASLVERILPHLAPHAVSLSVAKGLDDSGRPAAQIFHDVYGARHGYAVLYGPMISEEIRAGRPAFAQVGTSDPGLFSGIDALYAPTALALQFSEDLAGISWSSVLKNVYAMLFGAADETGLGDNVRGCLTVAALHEMQAIVVRLGGLEVTPCQLAGLGDLVTTATSEASHHHQLGRQLARGERQALQGEGIHTLAMIRQFGLLAVGDFPLFRLVQQLVDDPVDTERRIRDFLAAAVKNEK